MSEGILVAIYSGCKTVSGHSTQVRWHRHCRVYSSCEPMTKTFGYRVFYHVRDGVIYVLHCFTKKTDKTPQREIEIGRRRLSELKQQLAKNEKALTSRSFGPK